MKNAHCVARIVDRLVLYVETHEEAPWFGLIHPALPLFDLAAECTRTSIAT
jgi:hypothetical protein